MSELCEFSKTQETSHLYFLYKTMPCKMAHFDEQNGPFCDVK